jgi:molybdopterin converting factor small subunit
MKEEDKSTIKKNQVTLNISIGRNLGAKERRQKTLEVPEGTTAGEVMDQLLNTSIITFPENKTVHDIEKLVNNIQILINGKNIRYLDGMGTVISEHDKVVILKPLIGG